MPIFPRLCPKRLRRLLPPHQSSLSKTQVVFSQEPPRFPEGRYQDPRVRPSPRPRPQDSESDVTPVVPFGDGRRRRDRRDGGDVPPGPYIPPEMVGQPYFSSTTGVYPDRYGNLPGVGRTGSAPPAPGIIPGRFDTQPGIIPAGVDLRPGIVPSLGPGIIPTVPGSQSVPIIPGPGPQPTFIVPGLGPGGAPGGAFPPGGFPGFPGGAPVLGPGGVPIFGAAGPGVPGAGFPVGPGGAPIFINPPLGPDGLPLPGFGPGGPGGPGPVFLGPGGVQIPAPGFGPGFGPGVGQFWSWRLPRRNGWTSTTRISCSPCYYHIPTNRCDAGRYHCYPSHP